MEMTTKSSMSVNAAPSGRFFRTRPTESPPGQLAAFAPNRQYPLAQHIIDPFLSESPTQQVSLGKHLTQGELSYFSSIYLAKIKM
jgi:hypothetical protein